MAIWVTSDLHFNHQNILLFCRTQFMTIEEHNQYIVDRYNSIVGKDDLVYILGDVGFTPKNRLSPWIHALHGRKILIVGNHDTLKDSDYLGMGFIEVIRHPVYFTSQVILSHCPLQEALDNPYVINVHGHLHKSRLTLKNYLNVNIELHDYLPLNLQDIAKRAQKQCLFSRYQTFGHEWYASWEHEVEKVAGIT